MIIFTKDKAVPLNRIFQIYADKNKLFIVFESGFDGFKSGVDSVCVKCNSEDEVQKLFKQFYKAVRDGANVFYFN